MLRLITLVNLLVVSILALAGEAAAAVSVLGTTAPLAFITFYEPARKRLWHETGASLQHSGSSEMAEIATTVRLVWKQICAIASAVWNTLKKAVWWHSFP